MCNLKYDTNLFTKQTHRHREQICGCQGGGAGEGWIGSLGLADANYYIECINNKVLLYSTGNCIQYVINHNGKEKSKKGNRWPNLESY